MVDPLRLGASLYVPGIHPSVERVLRGEHPSRPPSVIVCTEDSIAEADVDRAIACLRQMLRRLPPLSAGPLRFIRPRNPAVLQQLLRLPGIDRVHGFVIPKADGTTLPTYLRTLGHRVSRLMPILETAAVFDRDGVNEIRHILDRESVRRRVVCLRIGGNDLLRLLGMKRFPGHTIYDTPLGALIPALVFAFRPAGYRLTGVACDDFADPHLLQLEARRDRLMGLIGKTAIHPSQVQVIQEVFNPTTVELDTARAIIDRASGGAFGMNGCMLEPAVHLEWANDIVASAQASGSPAAAVAGSRQQLANAGPL